MNDFLNENIFDVDCDLLLIPISTAGTISNSFRSGLEELDIATDLWEDKDYQLGDIKILPKKSKNKFIAFVCTVDGYDGAYYAIRLIGKRLAEKVSELKNIREIATPILGTGAGKLQPHLSLNIMRSAFYENKNVEGIRLTFCSMDKQVYSSLKSHFFDIDTPSSQMVIEAELSAIVENEIVQNIQYEKNFYFDLAVKKFHEFINFDSESRNFYEDLFDKFKFSKQTFQEFFKSELSEKQLEFTTLCGELIAYIDYRAYHKNIWNKYRDKRVLAQSAVRQTDWFLNLIKFKITGDLNALSHSIRAALLYLESPKDHLTMLSENHRKKVRENLFPYDNEYGERFEDIVLHFFRKLGVKSENPDNFSALCSRILYLPFIKPVWNETRRKTIRFSGQVERADLSRIGLLIEECLKTRSKKLDLGNCGLSDLTIIPELFECTHLEELILSNEWAIYEDGTWQRETSSNKGKPNNISVIPESISQLSELRTLICGGDWNVFKDKKWNRWGISTLSPITKLKKLEHLNISNNRLTSLIGLNKLTSLRFAHLNNNEISRVEFLTDLLNLKELNLSNNRIDKVEFLSALHSIQTLDLHHNSIKDLRPIRNIIERIGISNDKWEINTLNIANNPLEYPSMNFVDIGTEAVIGSFEDIEKRGQYKNKDIKVILVGNSEVGKSTLLKYLNQEIGLDEEHLPTLWMDERTIKSKHTIQGIDEKCVLRVFDFGGHDYYHDTHQLFYDNNTLYLLLWDTKTNKLDSRTTHQRTKDGSEVEIETQDYPLRYWLDSIKFHTKGIKADNFAFDVEIKEDEDDNVQLLVIQNKVADSSDIEFLENAKIKEQYPFIFDIINVSIKPKRNLDHFDNLFGEMLDKMKIIGTRLPKTYEPIKEKISAYDGKPILSLQEFLIYCNDILNDEDNPFDEAECRRLVGYLKRVGMLLYTDELKNEKIYIDKSWVTGNIYKVLENLVEKKGEFDRDYVVTVLGKDNSSVDDLLAMMQEFKMIFKHPGSDKFIAPLYLPKSPDDKVNLFLNNKQTPYRRFEYEGFIHKNVILDIFQHFGTLFPLNTNHDLFYYWKDALVIKNPNTDEIAMIKFRLGNKEGNACIDIYDLTKTTKNKPLFINQVRQYILEVNKGFELEEMVTLNGEDFISTRVLKENATVGKHIFSEKKFKDFKNPNKKEKKYFNLKEYMEFIDNPIKKKSVVISYSKYDLAQVHIFERYLRPLVDWGLIEEPWCCENLITGDLWDERIRERFNQADIVFFMVSPNLFSTQYVIENEIKDAIERYDSDNSSVKIVPIILEYYEWGRKGKINLQRFSAMPFKGKPISGFKNQNLAWHTITQAIKIMIEHDISPEKSGAPNREIQEIYERQIAGKLDDNSI
ncbi:hypothetical protein GCM10009118_18460 [Wandonia haliotis]|uniref:COR domain-containing protein n=1 Tax=Wandonia haliotis TaxID=574963 RepID=A0ABN1MQ25_9FLAO